MQKVQKKLTIKYMTDSYGNAKDYLRLLGIEVVRSKEKMK